MQPTQTATPQSLKTLRPILLRRAQKLSKHPTQAEDLTQNVLLKLIEAQNNPTPNTPKTPSQQRAWALTVLYRDWVSTLRKQSVRTRYQKNAQTSRSDHSISQHSQKLSQSSENPFIDYVQQKQNQKSLRQALATLPRDQRRVIELVDLRGYSTQESAQTLQCPAGTIMSRLHRGRRRLKERLKGLAQSHRPSNSKPLETFSIRCA